MAISVDSKALRKSAATRRRILDAAAGLFRHNGFAATRLSDIAEAADIQPGSMYYHFDSKEHLVAAVLDIGVARVFQAVRRRVEALPHDVGARRRIAAAVSAHLEMMLQHDDYTSANIRIIRQVPREIRESHLRRHRDYGDYWRRLLEEARATGEIADDVDLSALRMIVLGALNWSVEWYRPGRLAIGDIADLVTRLVFDGVGASGRERRGA